MNRHCRARQVQFDDVCEVEIGIGLESGGIVNRERAQRRERGEGRAVSVSDLAETQPQLLQILPHRQHSAKVVQLVLREDSTLHFQLQKVLQLSQVLPRPLLTKTRVSGEIQMSQRHYVTNTLDTVLSDTNTLRNVELSQVLQRSNRRQHSVIH